MEENKKDEEKRKAGRPRQNAELKKVKSIRLTQTAIKLMTKRYGTLQKGIEKLVIEDCEKFIRGE